MIQGLPQKTIFCVSDRLSMSNLRNGQVVRMKNEPAVRVDPPHDFILCSSTSVIVNYEDRRG